MARIRSTPRDRSGLVTNYTAEPEGDQFTLWLDVHITRRKRFHMICRFDGEPVFRSRYVGDCIRWLTAHQISSFRITVDGVTWSAALNPEEV